MAVTKIKPIRGTVNKALAYILDPEKTDDQLYVSSFGCAARRVLPKSLNDKKFRAQQGAQIPKSLQTYSGFDVGESLRNCS